jgi:hypothetical protein
MSTTVKKIANNVMNGMQTSTSGSSSEDQIHSLKAEFAEKESMYHSKIA